MIKFFCTHEVLDPFRTVSIDTQLKRELETARRSLLLAEHMLEDHQAASSEALSNATIYAESAKIEKVRVQLLTERINRLQAHAASAGVLNLTSEITNNG